MRGDLAFISGYAEGREWAVNWAGEEVLKRVAGRAPALEANSTESWPMPNGTDANRVLEELTSALVSSSLPPVDLRAFWRQALPDVDSATLHNLEFLRGFLAGARYIAQEPL